MHAMSTYATGANHLQPLGHHGELCSIVSTNIFSEKKEKKRAMCVCYRLHWQSTGYTFVKTVCSSHNVGTNYGGEAQSGANVEGK